MEATTSVKQRSVGIPISLVKDIATFHSFGTHSCRHGPSQSSTILTNVLRLTEKHFISKIPQLGRRKKKRCHPCNLLGQCKETSYHCRHCVVVLCIEPCFEIYHTKADAMENLAESNIEDD